MDLFLSHLIALLTGVVVGIVLSFNVLRKNPAWADKLFK